MHINGDVFGGCMPALMTPCDEQGNILYDDLVRKGQELVEQGMRGVVYCGSMGDWPLLTEEQRQEGVARLAAAGVPVVVGTGAQNTRLAAAHAAHAKEVGAAGLMVIPRLLSRTSSPAAQGDHFSAILEAGQDLPAVIYNSPYYGFQTRENLFFSLHERYPQLVGFKEFGGAEALTYAAENITSGNENLMLIVGVDTEVYHGFVKCGAQGAITGVGNAFPKEILYFISLARKAASGDVVARRFALELSEALSVLSQFDEGPDLVLYYKYLMVLEGNPEYQHHFNRWDCLTSSQRAHTEQQWKLFRTWWDNWDGKP